MCAGRDKRWTYAVREEHSQIHCPIVLLQRREDQISWVCSTEALASAIDSHKAAWSRIAEVEWELCTVGSSCKRYVPVSNENIEGEDDWPCKNVGSNEISQRNDDVEDAGANDLGDVDEGRWNEDCRAVVIKVFETWGPFNRIRGSFLLRHGGNQAETKEAVGSRSIMMTGIRE